jgi:hypothetical protein
MALKQVAIVQPKIEERETPKKKGWGEALGAAVGVGAAVAGGMAAGPGGAAMAQGVIGGAGGGYALGNLVGEKMSPTVEAKREAIQRQAAPGPQIQTDHSEKLKASIMALHQAPPDVQQAYSDPLAAAYLKTRMG